MVKVKDAIPIEDGHINIDAWLDTVAQRGFIRDIAFIRSACVLSQCVDFNSTVETGESCLYQALSMADILVDLHSDVETIVAAIVYVGVYYAELTLEDVEEQLGAGVAKIVSGVIKMNVISNTKDKMRHNKTHLDNVRKMLIAMIDDVRVVLIKLADRLCILRSASLLPLSMRKFVAIDAMNIYAPLANRLGIGAIKWEMEDLSLRYLQPEDYKAIAKGLNAKRLERDSYVQSIVNILNVAMYNSNLSDFSVGGRAKHIHSIYRKMQQKNLKLEQVHDSIAVRVLVASTEQCYEVLGLIHNLWQQIESEFDDYIIKPKANGYQSLHTAVIGPEDRIFEVQIRTFAMHAQAEMGVAAHWKYKEGLNKKSSDERKIEWLREVLAWHSDINKDLPMEAAFLEDRVYVFTPEGDILDLPAEVTALDFAYYLHTDLGHRCRGAKVNGVIVPLTYTLKTGDKVEILTAKVAKPSRDWLNPHLNYLKTARGRAKVLHWFKQQNYDKNCLEGQHILEKELKTLNLKITNLQEIAKKLYFHKADDLLAALGRGELKLGQVISQVMPENDLKNNMVKIYKTGPEAQANHGFLIEGVGRLVTNIARCCNPNPNDAVIGYITIGRGISVHKKDCPYVLHASEKQKDRFLQVNWSQEKLAYYDVDIIVKAFDRRSLLKDVTSLLVHEKTHVKGLQTLTNADENTTDINLKVAVDGVNTLMRVLNKLKQIDNVFLVERL
jgi:GTP pyrophosphokinase